MKHLDLFLCVPDVFIIALQLEKMCRNFATIEGETYLKEVCALKQK